MNRTRNAGGSGGEGGRCLGEQGAGLAWIWRGQGPTSTHFDTPRVWHGCGPVTPSMGLVCPLCSLPLSIETLIFFSFLKDHLLIPQGLLDFSLMPTWGNPKTVCAHFLQLLWRQTARRVRGATWGSSRPPTYQDLRMPPPALLARDRSRSRQVSPGEAPLRPPSLCPNL